MCGASGTSVERKRARSGLKNAKSRTTARVLVSIQCAASTIGTYESDCRARKKSVKFGPVKLGMSQRSNRPFLRQPPFKNLHQRDVRVRLPCLGFRVWWLRGLGFKIHGYGVQGWYDSHGREDRSSSDDSRSDSSVVKSGTRQEQ